MKYIHFYTLFLMLVFHTSCGQNQTNPPQDNTRQGYTESQLKEAATTKGVPVGMVRHVRKARNGDILIASWLAVFRYDGTSFTNLTGKIISPRFASFWDVLEDRKGNLWFASRVSGVYYYNGKSFQHFTIREGLANNSVGKIYEDKTGNIWFATGGGASRYDGKSFRNFTTKDGLPNNDINSIMEDKTGKLWFGTRGDACFYDGKTFTVLKNKDGKAFKNVWSIIEDKKGNIWTTGEVNPKVWALSRYDAKSLYDKTPTVTEIKSGGRMEFLGILEANDGSIWFGSAGVDGGGVQRYDGKTITHFKSKEGQQ
ncbi:MAG TPA: two-component regulator propeller domain-containing protein [Ferruginibacter sp.]|nr:two-component regulator propeller domain-containing protein [Ferruginibacter sp.]